MLCIASLTFVVLCVQCLTLFTLLSSTALALFLSAASVPAQDASVPLGLWEPMIGDSLLIDTETNMGYLVHDDGAFTSFEVVTGRRSTVWYIGRVYNATTPERDWVIKEESMKGDRITFGKDGYFLRLFHEGETTPYGIHGYGREENMFALSPRYGSMGCIIVRDNVLQVIRKTFVLNPDGVHVSTRFGMQNEMAKLAAK